MNGCMLSPGLVSRRSTGSDTGERALLLIEHGDLHDIRHNGTEPLSTLNV